jgi:hypothetical protein
MRKNTQTVSKMAGKYMKKISLLSFVVLTLYCYEKKMDREKEKGNFFSSVALYNYYIASNRNSHTGTQTSTGGVCANISGIIVSTNVKSIDVYKDGSLSFSQTTTNTSFRKNSACEENYSIYLDSNSLYLSGVFINNCKNGECDAAIGVKGAFVTYKTKFNKDFNTFTEIVAGEYRFVPVR